MRCIISTKDCSARHGMHILLTEEGYDAISVRDEQELNTALVNDSPAVVIYQPYFSCDDGALLAAIRMKYPGVAIIAYIMPGDLYGLRQCIHEDVHSLVFNTDKFAEIPAALHSISKGIYYYSHSVQQVMYQYHIRIGDEMLLTKNEQQLLHYIGRGQNNAAIAKLLYCSEHTVKAMRKKMLAKTNTSNMAALICYALRYGHLRLYVAE